MSASWQIALWLLTILASSLSSTTVTKEDLDKGNVPIRVTVSSAADGMVTLQFEYDCDLPNQPSTHVERVRMVLYPKSAGAVSIRVRTPKGTRKTVGSITVTPEFAVGGRMGVFVGHGTTEHVFGIALDLVADEMKKASKEVLKAARPSAGLLTKEDLTKNGISVRVLSWRPSRASIRITYDDDPERPGSVFNGVPKKDGDVEMVLYVNEANSNRRIAIVPLDVRAPVLSDELTFTSDLETPPDFALNCQVRVTIKGGSPEAQSFLIPLEVFAEEMKFAK